MLGPEQVNLSVKPTPVFMEGAPALKLSSVLARELGLADNQIIKAVVVASKSGFFLTLPDSNRRLQLPNHFAKLAGEQVSLKVSLFGSGDSILRLSQLDRTPQGPGLTQSKSITSDSTVLSNRSPIRELSFLLQNNALVKSVMSQADTQFLHTYPPGLRVALIKALMARSGSIGSKNVDIGHAGYSIAHLLRQALRADLGPDSKGVIELLEILEGRTSRAHATRSDALAFECLSIANECPLDIHCRREPVAGEKDVYCWNIDIHLIMPGNRDVWLGIRHQLPNVVGLQAWIPDIELFSKAMASQDFLRGQLDEFDVSLDGLELYNQARSSSALRSAEGMLDKVEVKDAPTSLDLSV